MATAFKLQPTPQYDVTVCAWIGQPDTWNVEAVDDDGSIEQAIFAGPNAETRAREYAGQIYGA